MSYLIPVTRDLAEARLIANSRGGDGDWLILKDETGLYFVVPRDDRGFDSLGSLVEIVRSKRRIATKSLV